MSVSKMIMGQAANQYVAPTYVEDVFSTYLYDGTGSAQTITNGIDLSGEGGLVWIKNRDSANGHNLEDTERGAGKTISSNSTDEEFNLTGTSGLSSFNSNGFSITGSQNRTNTNGDSYAAWTWRKAPKFFDIQTFSGDGATTRTLSHNLGAEVGMMIIKSRSTSAQGEWWVYHRSMDANPETKQMQLSETYAANNAGNVFGATKPTSTQFSVGSGSNYSGQDYIVYLFAHNNSDGEFGPDADQDVIKCGSYTGNGSTTGVFQDLGFEPQWIIFKETTITEPWVMLDNMRGVSGLGSNDPRLQANRSVAEAGGEIMQFNATGFTPLTADDKVNGSGRSYIYMAIRRGPMATPTSATDVFDVNTHSNNSNSNIFNTGFNPDMNITTRTAAAPNYILSRLTGAKYLQTELADAEVTSSGTRFWDKGNNLIDLATNWWGQNDVVSWTWKRAPSYFDVVAYSGTGSNRTISHNLGVVPEMIWVKRRSGATNWAVYHKGTDASAPEDYYLEINTTTGRQDDSNRWNDTAPTSSVFTVSTGNAVNGSGETYIAYLFATLTGISKVGSYTGNGSTQTIDCGFSSGARFVLIKITSGTGDWRLYDTVRGIVAGDDPQLVINNNSAELSSGYDLIDPHSSGFALPASPYTNNSGETYIFYAIA